MAVTYGFFNSVNGDRKYNAEQMSEYFRGIINEGVYQHLDGGLAVTAGTGLAVNVAAGRAIIQNRWVQNSAAMSLTIAAASETYARKDAVVIRLNWSSRSISIAVKTGTPAASPVAPSMTRNSTTYEMALAYVNVAANATSVTVTDKRSDSTVCGWVTVAQSTSGEVDAMLNDMKTGFDGVTYASPAEMVTSCDQKVLARAYVKTEKDCGIVNTVTNPLYLGTSTDGIATGNVGSQISYGSQTYWKRFTVDAKNYKSCSITYYTGDNTTVTDYIFVIDSNNIILAKYGEAHSQHEMATTTFTLPDGADRIVLNSAAYTSSNAPYGSYTAVYNLQSQILDQSVISASDAAYVGSALTYVTSATGYLTPDASGKIKVNSHSNWNYKKFEVGQGTYYCSTVRASSATINFKYIYITDANDNILDELLDPVSTADIVDDYKVVITNENAKYLYIQTYTTTHTGRLVCKSSVNVSDELKEFEGYTQLQLDSSFGNTFGGFNMICRLGYGAGHSTSQGDFPPEMSIPAYMEAYKGGWRNMICDVRSTSDGYLVGLHDASINNIARNHDGSQISSTVNIADITLDQADDYDFGIYRGEKYAGTKIIRIEDFIRWCKFYNCICHLEIKVELTSEQISNLVNTIKLYGMEEMMMFNGNVTTLLTLSANFPSAHYAVFVSELSQSTINTVAGYNFNDGKKVMVMDINANGYSSITKENALLCAGNDISIWISCIYTEQLLEQVIAADILQYCKFVSSDTINLYDYIKTHGVM